VAADNDHPTPAQTYFFETSPRSAISVSHVHRMRRPSAFAAHPLAGGGDHGARQVSRVTDLFPKAASGELHIEVPMRLKH